MFMCIYMYTERELDFSQFCGFLFVFSPVPLAPPLGDETHKIPISGFHLPRSCYAVVLRELVEFARPARGARPRFFCRVWPRSKL